MNQENDPPSEKPEAGTMLRREIHSIIRRYGHESDITVYQAIGALRVVEHDLLESLDGLPGTLG